MLIAVLNLLIAVVVSQYLGAAGKGQQSILITTIALVLLVCNIAGGASLVYLVPRHDNFKILLPSYAWSLLVCVVVFLFMGLFHDIPDGMLFHVCTLTLVSSLTAVNSTILLGHERIHIRNMIAVVQTAVLVLSLLFMFLVLQRRDIYAYIISLYVAFTVAFIMSALYVTAYIEKDDKKETNYRGVLKDMFKYGFLNQLSHITQLLSLRLSYYLLLLYSGEHSVGIYSNAVALTEAVWLVSKSIATVQYARIANTDNDEYARDLTLKLLKPSLLVGVFLLLPLALLPGSFYTLLFGSEFAEVNRLVAVLAPGVLLYNISLITGHYFSGKGRYHVNTIASFAGLLVTLAGGWLLIPVWGMYGAALTAVLSFACTSLYVLYVFRREAAFPLSALLPRTEDIKIYVTMIRDVLKSPKPHNHEQTPKTP